MTTFIICMLAFANIVNEPENDYLKYYELINEATYASFQKDYEKADSIFQKAFALDILHLNRNYETAFENVLNLNKTEQSFIYLKKAIQHGLSIEKIKTRDYFKQIQYKEQWIILEKLYPELREQYESQFDTELRQTIQEIYQRDQDARLKGTENFDADNLERLKKIVEEHGYPGFHKVGQDIDLHIVFHHFLPENNEQYFYKILKEAVFTGDISPFQYAAIIDYDRLKQSEPTIYGTYFTTIDGIRYLQPVDDFDNVNERRKAIGLEPIEHQMEKHDIMLDVNFFGF